MGYTGVGVTVAIVDDGVDYESIDLAENFVRTLTNHQKEYD
jgi:subtilisin family serine protease